MSDIAIQFTGVINSLDPNYIKLKKPKGLFLLRKDYNTILLLKKSSQLYQETIELGVNNLNPLVSRSVSSKSKMTRTFSKPFFSHNKIPKPKVSKNEEKVVLPKLIILSNRNSLCNSKNVSARDTKIGFYRKSSRNIHKKENS
jgi:hypothetical protein